MSTTQFEMSVVKSGDTFAFDIGLDRDKNSQVNFLIDDSLQKLVESGTAVYFTWCHTDEVFEIAKALKNKNLLKLKVDQPGKYKYVLSTVAGGCNESSGIVGDGVGDGVTRTTGEIIVK